jgi:hypothetical protein
MRVEAAVIEPPAQHFCRSILARVVAAGLLVAELSVDATWTVERHQLAETLHEVVDEG